MERSQVDKIATEKAKEERLAQAQAARIAMMTPEQRADMQKIQEEKAAQKAAAETKKAAAATKKAEAQTNKELQKATKAADKRVQDAQKAIKAEGKTAAAALAAAAGQ